MYVFGMMQTLKIAIAYFFMVIFLPALILRKRFNQEPLTKRLMIYLVFGNIYLSTLVFTLAYLNGFNRFNLVISILFTSVLLLMGIYRKDFFEALLQIKERIREIFIGEYGFHLLAARTLEKGRNYLKKLSSQLFQENKIEWLVFLLILAYSIYQYGINSIEYMTYMAPDEEVHLYWIQSLLQGNIFPSGVYPHVFHTILAVLINLFHFNAMNITLYFGIISNFLIMTMLYLGLRKIFKSKYAALLAFMLYTTIDIYLQGATYRFQFSIPQEYAMIMLMPMALFLFDYIQEQKRSDLLFFGLALSLTVGIHFYTGAIAVILAVAIGLTYLSKIIREKLLFKLLLSGVLSAVIALAPLAIGVATGHELEQSFAWGTEVLKGDIYSKTSTGIVKEEADAEELSTLTFDRFLRGAKIDAEKYAVHDVRILYFFLVIIVLSILYNLRVLHDEQEDAESRYQIAFAINSLLLLLLILFKSLNLPTIMEPKRLAIYFAYFSSVFLGMPLELLSRTMSTIKLKKGIPIFSIGVILSSFLFILNQNLLRPLPFMYYFQTTGSIITNMKVIDEYEDYTWTAISPVNNISPIMNNGYHYELSDFILSQENWHDKKELRIPTKYVFLYIEKRPIVNYGSDFYRGDSELDSRAKLKKEDALKKLSDTKIENYHYIKERNILMSKAYYWAEAYQEYFPKEINVYYEDSDLIVYRIKQNEYALNNLSIDYGINKK